MFAVSSAHKIGREQGPESYSFPCDLADCDGLPLLRLSFLLEEQAEIPSWDKLSVREGVLRRSTLSRTLSLSHSFRYILNCGDSSCN